MKSISTARRLLLTVALALPLSLAGGPGAAFASPLAGEDAASSVNCEPSEAAGSAGAAGTDSAGSDSAGTDSAGTLAAGPLTVWLAGDSTMANGSACPIGWGSQYDALFNSDVTVVNSAVGGRSVQTWLYDPNVTTTMNPDGECLISPETYSDRWLAMLDANTGMKAGDYLFIQFGINDGSATCNRHVGSARYTYLLGVMAQAAKDRGAIPVFLTPVAAITCSGNTAVGNRGFITETLAAGTANDVAVIDLHQLSLNLYNSLGLCPNNSDYTTGAVGAFFCNDHTHFEAAGAQQIARVVAQALRDKGIALAEYLL